MSDDKAEINNEFLGELTESGKIVIKIGSALLVETDNKKIKPVDEDEDEAKNKIKTNWINNLAMQVAKLVKQGSKVVLVSSGAVGAGKIELKIPFADPIPLDGKQAAAATGNPILMQEYKNAFKEYDLPVAQVLITPACTQEPRRRLNLQDTIESLLNSGVIPIINENDTIATMEIRYGDNDRLSALVAGVIRANWLILLSDVDGLYKENPADNPEADFFTDIHKIDGKIMSYAKGAGTSVSTGGMRTKLLAAKIATEEHGCHMLIANGTHDFPIQRLFENTAKASWFHAQSTPNITHRRNIIERGLQRKGAMIVISDKAFSEGQIQAIHPADVVNVIGEFDRGETVNLYTEHSFEQLTPIGVAITDHSDKDVKKIMGLQREEEITAALGYFGRQLIARKDNLYLIEQDHNLL